MNDTDKSELEKFIDFLNDNDFSGSDDYVRQAITQQCNQARIETANYFMDVVIHSPKDSIYGEMHDAAGRFKAELQAQAKEAEGA